MVALTLAKSGSVCCEVQIKVLPLERSQEFEGRKLRGIDFWAGYFIMYFKSAFSTL